MPEWRRQRALVVSRNERAGMHSRSIPINGNHVWYQTIMGRNIILRILKKQPSTKDQVYPSQPNFDGECCKYATGCPLLSFQCATLSCPSRMILGVF